MKDDKNDIISPEIIKLTEKMAKDPASTLFFPLAEEYRRCGMLDEAIILLTDGLKNHPNFLSARVSLGKIYLQKGLVSEAKHEFERVIQSAPDNLLAQKKLAMIYREEGDREKALESCRRLLLLNPNDEEIKKIKSELEAKVEETGKVELHQEEKEPIKLVPVIEERVQTDESIILKPEEAVAERVEEKEIEAESSPVYEIKDEDIDLREIFSGEPGADLEAGVKDKAEEDSTLSDIFKVTQDEEEKGEETPVYEITETDEEVSLNEMLVGREKVEETSILQEETLIRDQPVAEEGPLDEKEVKVDITVDKKDESIHEEIASEALAELYMRQEEFDKAIEILKILSDKDPFNETLRQKIEDAATLKNLMGREVMPEDYDILREEPSKIEEVSFTEPTAKVIEGPKIPEENALEAISTVGQDVEDQKVKKIKRLEQWLENIKRSHAK